MINRLNDSKSHGKVKSVFPFIRHRGEEKPIKQHSRFLVFLTKHRNSAILALGFGDGISERTGGKELIIKPYKYAVGVLMADYHINRRLNRVPKQAVNHVTRLVRRQMECGV